MTYFREIAGQEWFHWIFFVVLGATLGAWSDWAIRKWEKSKLKISENPQPQSDVSIEQDIDAVTEMNIEQLARDDLEMFVTDHLLKTCGVLISIQSELVRYICGSEIVSDMAKNGLLRRWDLREFDEGYEAISGFGDSPVRAPDIEALVDAVDKIEKNYATLCEQGDRLSDEAGIEIGGDEQIDRLYEEWRSGHNAMIAAYDQFKKNPKVRQDDVLRKLHRPMRKSRFGDQFLIEENIGSRIRFS